MVNRICVYAIAKNEEKNVDAWYESMMEADSIVVLDTGSTDGTIQKLQAHGIHVEQKTYERFRFDQARNDSLKLIPDDCNILVTTDLDERFEPGWADILRARWIEGRHTRANYTYRFRDEEFDQSLNWIHDRSWSWLYPCHEAMQRNDAIWYYPDETLDIYEIVLHHYPDHTKNRGSYIDLLRIRYEENPDDVQSLVYLIREFTYKNSWAEIITFEPLIRKTAASCRPEDACAALTYLGDAFCATGNINAGMGCYFEALQRYDGERIPYIRLARRLIDAQQPLIAKSILLHCLKRSRRTPIWTWLDTDEVWSWELFDWLCVACYWAGEYREAIAYASLALKNSPGNEHVMKNLKLSLDKEGEDA